MNFKIVQNYLTFEFRLILFRSLCSILLKTWFLLTAAGIERRSAPPLTSIIALIEVTFFISAMRSFISASLSAFWPPYLISEHSVISWWKSQFRSRLTGQFSKFRFFIQAGSDVLAKSYPSELTKGKILKLASWSLFDKVDARFTQFWIPSKS